MVQVGKWQTLRVVKEVDFGCYLDGEPDEILLPKRYVPAGLQPGDDVRVFIYHDNEKRLIATTDSPLGVVGDIVMLEVTTTTEYGAFLKWGIMKDLFVPIALQERRMKPGDRRFVWIFIDEMTGRVAASEKIDKHISNYELTVKVNDPVDLLIYQQTELGYKAIINNVHMGLLHASDVFRELHPGDKLKGFVKHIRPDHKIDLAAGTRGYAKVTDDEALILNKLKDNNNYLPYNDKSAPEEIYEAFGMSKKTFKMILGSLYKQRRIEFAKTGIQLCETDSSDSLSE